MIDLEKVKAELAAARSTGKIQGGEVTSGEVATPKVKIARRKKGQTSSIRPATFRPVPPVRAASPAHRTVPTAGQKWIRCELVRPIEENPQYPDLASMMKAFPSEGKPPNALTLFAVQDMTLEAFIRFRTFIVHQCSLNPRPLWSSPNIARVANLLALKSLKAFDVAFAELQRHQASLVHLTNIHSFWNIVRAV